MTDRASYPAAEVPFAEDSRGVWHIRVDDFWDNDAGAEIRAHTVCGQIWSCHVSEYHPREVADQRRVPLCHACFPVGTRRMGRTLVKRGSRGGD